MLSLNLQKKKTNEKSEHLARDFFTFVGIKRKPTTLWLIWFGNAKSLIVENK